MVISLSNVDVAIILVSFRGYISTPWGAFDVEENHRPPAGIEPKPS
jgi:hypothetical protein